MTRDELRAFLQPLPDEAIVGLTVYGEARGEPIEGQVAVGCVIRNRLHDTKKRYGTRYRDVCLKKMQFSCFNPSDTDPNFRAVLRAAQTLLEKGTPDDALEQAAWVALGIHQHALTDNTKGANHYHTAALTPRPAWAQSYIPVTQKGAHVFYRL